jgi:lipid-binding SYLF domain-containing protein
VFSPRKTSFPLRVHFCVQGQMAADPGMDWFRKNVQKAKAVVIVPSTVKAGFTFGGSGGNGVVMTRGGKSWSHPCCVHGHSGH